MLSKNILICSNNPHKLHECAAIAQLYEYGLSFCNLAEVNQGFSCPETGNSFLENAFQKAAAYQDQNPNATLYPFLVEDSGLSVAALGGAPGIYSARYGQEHGVSSDQERALFLLDRLAAAPASSKRTAHYSCTTVLYLSSQQYILVEEIWAGSISNTYHEGGTGFGYDPVFLPQGSSRPVSLLRESEKHRTSHRSRALRRIFHAYEACPI